MGEKQNYSSISHFFEQLTQGTQTAKFDDCFRQIQEVLPSVAPDQNIGRICFQLMGGQSILGQIAENGIKVLYDNPLGAGDVPHVKMNRDQTGTTFSFMTYPVKGHTFTEEELFLVDAITHFSFLLLSQSRAAVLLERAQITDPLTLGLNLNGLMRIGKSFIEKGQISKYYGVFLNIKNFKYINQNVGPSNGDYLLKKLHQRLSNTLQNDEACARLGGDNFILLIRKERLDIFLKRNTILTFDMHTANPTPPVSLELRMGIYAAREGDQMADIMSKTTSAFAQSRMEGNADIVWFEDYMIEQEIQAKQVGSMFPEAIANKEFLVYYQPKVLLNSHELCGSEALVRWMRNGELIPPMAFVPALEKSGNVCELDYYVFEQVCKDLKEWESQGIQPVKVSTNFSKNHLMEPNFGDRILSLIQQYDVNPAYLEIELTETRSNKDIPAMDDFILRMKENGLSISIDDFGTGYSSLNLLKDLHVDTIKLDRAFVYNIENENLPDRIVIKNIVNMVKELGMEVIAEGVETQAQVDFLKSIRCNMAQGYLFDKPLPKDEYELRLTKKRTYKLNAEV